MKHNGLIVLAAAVLLAPSWSEAQSPIPLGVAIRIGGGITRDGGHPGGLFSVDAGPYQGFVEFFDGDGWRQVNFGANLLVIDVPLPILRPFAGVGAGFTRNSTGTGTDGHIFFDALAGVDIKGFTGFTFFTQAKYIYSLGSGPNIRDVVAQGGLTFRIGL